MPLQRLVFEQGLLLVVEVVSWPHRCPAVPLPQPPLPPGLLYYFVRVGGSPHPSCDCVGGFFYRCGRLWPRGSRSAPVSPPRVEPVVQFVAGGVDDAPWGLLPPMAVVEGVLLESDLKVG